MTCFTLEKKSEVALLFWLGTVSIKHNRQTQPNPVSLCAAAEPGFGCGREDLGQPGNPSSGAFPGHT